MGADVRSEFWRESMLKVKLSSSDNIDELLAQTPSGKGVWGNCDFLWMMISQSVITGLCLIV